MCFSATTNDISFYFIAYRVCCCVSSHQKIVHSTTLTFRHCGHCLIVTVPLCFFGCRYHLVYIESSSFCICLSMIANCTSVCISLKKKTMHCITYDDTSVINDIIKHLVVYEDSRPNAQITFVGNNSWL